MSESNEIGADNPLLLLLRCWECKNEWNGFFPDGLAGKWVTCPKCGHSTNVRYAMQDIAEPKLLHAEDCPCPDCADEKWKKP